MRVQLCEFCVSVCVREYMCVRVRVCSFVCAYLCEFCVCVCVCVMCECVCVCVCVLECYGCVGEMCCVRVRVS